MTRTSLPVSVGLVVLIMLSCFFIPSSVEAKQISGIVTIDPGGNYGWRMDVAMPSQLEYQISVLNGTTVDILVLDDTNYTMYTQNQTFEYYEEYSALDTSNASANFTVLSGTVYVIVDNTGMPNGSSAASPTKPAQVEYWIASTFDLHAIPDQGTPWIAFLLIAVFAVSLPVVIIVTRKAIRQRRSALGDIEDLER